MKQEHATDFPLVWGFFPPYSFFLAVLSARAILQVIREDGCIYGVWISYAYIFTL